MRCVQKKEESRVRGSILYIIYTALAFKVVEEVTVTHS